MVDNNNHSGYVGFRARPRISVIYYTFKYGGLDMLAKSLSEQTFSDYELIVIDDLANRNREKAAEFFRREGIPLAYIGPSKAKCYPDLKFGQNNAINTGFMKSCGELCVAVCDMCYLRKDALKKWDELFSKQPDIAAHGVAQDWDYPEKPIEDDINTFPNPFDMSKAVPRQNSTGGMWIPSEWEMFYCCLPRELVIRMNGFDERADAWRETIAISTSTQIKKNGRKLYVDQDNVVDLIFHRGWETPNAVWVMSKLYPDAIDPGHWPDWPARAPNCFQL